MNQQQLNAIKARAESAQVAGNGPVDLEKVKAVALFRQHVVGDVLALVAEVERLRAACQLVLDECQDVLYAARLEAVTREVKNVLQDEVERLTPKPRRQLTPEEIQERIDDNFFEEEYD